MCFSCLHHPSYRSELWSCALFLSLMVGVSSRSVTMANPQIQCVLLWAVLAGEPGDAWASAEYDAFPARHCTLLNNYCGVMSQSYCKGCQICICDFSICLARQQRRQTAAAALNISITIPTWVKPQTFLNICTHPQKSHVIKSCACIGTKSFACRNACMVSLEMHIYDKLHARMFKRFAHNCHKAFTHQQMQQRDSTESEASCDLVCLSIMNELAVTILVKGWISPHQVPCFFVSVMTRPTQNPFAELGQSSINPVPQLILVHLLKWKRWNRSSDRFSSVLSSKSNRLSENKMM